MEGQARSLISSVRERYGVALPAGPPLMMWGLRHGAWLLEPYGVGADAHTLYYRQHLRNYPRAVLPFGETVRWI